MHRSQLPRSKLHRSFRQHQQRVGLRQRPQLIGILPFQRTNGAIQNQSALKRSTGRSFVEGMCHRQLNFHQTRLFKTHENAERPTGIFPKTHQRTGRITRQSKDQRLVSNTKKQRHAWLLGYAVKHFVYTGIAQSPATKVILTNRYSAA